MNQKKIFTTIAIGMMLVSIALAFAPTIKASEAILCTVKGMVFIDNVSVSAGEAEVQLIFADPDEIFSNISHLPCAACDDVYYTIITWNEEEDRWREEGDVGTFKVNVGYNYFTPYDNKTFTAVSNFVFVDLHINKDDTLPPNKPTNPSPSNGANLVNTSLTLSVEVSDPDGDYMDVSFYDSSDTLIGIDTYVPNGGTASVNWSLNLGMTYSWYAIASDSIKENRSDIWSFTTTGSIQLTRPEVDGPQIGTKDVEYSYSAQSTSANNDTIQYIFNWGDGETNTTDFLPNGTATTQKHTWTAAGKYAISVTAFDNTIESESTEYIVLIDALDVGDIGFFTDDDGDSAYDTFHNGSTGDVTDVGLDNGNYLIDINGDGEWDYVYDSDTGELEEYVTEDGTSEDKKSTPSLGLIGVILITIVVVMLKTKRSPKKPGKK